MRVTHPTSTKPLIIEQATVQWVKGLEFGITFRDLEKREADQLLRLRGAFLESGSYRGRPAGSLNVKPPAA